MIGRLAGTLIEKMPPQILLDVAGVGYELEVPMSTFYELPEAGESVVLMVHMVVREDAQLLYGFGSRQERALFRLLLKVNGVGAKVALAILSTMNTADFTLAVERDDIATLVRIPGIGKKTAERLVVEMRDKLAAMPAELVAPGATAVGAAGGAGAGTEAASDDGDQNVVALVTGSPRSQAIDALIALGYKQAEATKMVDSAVPRAKAGEFTVEDIIRAALQSSVPG